LCNEIGLDITIIVFACPDISSFSFDDLGNHIINESVFIPEFLGLKFFFVSGFVEALEDVFESSIIFFKDSVFGCHVKWIVSGEGVFEASVGKILD